MIETLEQRKFLSLAKITAAFAKFAFDTQTPFEDRLVVESLLMKADKSAPQEAAIEVSAAVDLLNTALIILHRDAAFDSVGEAAFAVCGCPDCGLFHLIIRGPNVTEDQAIESMMLQHSIEMQKSHAESSLMQTESRQYLERIMQKYNSDPQSD